ncbi:MAG: hypothetical protein ACLPT4_07915, partial [Verrucomicrobiia bacterium]
YALGGVILCLLIVLGWFAFRQEPPSQNQQPVEVEAAKPIAPALEPNEGSANKEATRRIDDSAATNAAAIYRRAFDLFDQFSKDQKYILSDWSTNVDASVEAELCGKLRPISDLMRQATAVTNCDWGFDPINNDTKLPPYLNPSRNIARAALWNAAHCQSNDVAGATDDALSVLRLGQNISQGGPIGFLVGTALQGLVAAFVAQNVGSFGDADILRLTTAFNDPAYEEEASRAMEQEADMHDHYAAKLATMTAAEVEQEFSEGAKELAAWVNGLPTNLDQATILAAYEQCIDSERQLAKTLASSSEDAYEAWQKEAAELQASNPLAKLLLENDESFVNRAQIAAVNRTLVVAGLAVAQGGMDALQSYSDPASGQPFVYTETADGFELQSAYQVYGKPMTMQFKQTR